MDKRQKSWQSRIAKYLQLKWEIPRRELTSLSKDFGLLLVVLGKELPKYPKLAERKNISTSTMFHALIVCCKCSQSEEEGTPLSTGMFLTDSNVIAQILPDEIEITLPKKLRIAHWKKIRDLCCYVDGETAAFVVEKSNGEVKGAKNLQTALLRDRNAYVEITDRINDSVAFLVVRGRKCFRLYSDGTFAHQVILVRKYGEWISRDLSSYFKKLDSIASSKSIHTDDVHIIFQASLMISERRLGAQFLIGDRKNIQDMIRSENMLKFPKKIRDMTEEELIRDVTKDGAAIFSKSGELESIEAKFFATGGRLASIQDVTKKAQDALAIVVKMDGAVFVVENGEIVNKLQ